MPLSVYGHPTRWDYYRPAHSANAEMQMKSLREVVQTKAQPAPGQRLQWLWADARAAPLSVSVPTEQEGERQLRAKASLHTPPHRTGPAAW